jgi:hypothetical protein
MNFIKFFKKKKPIIFVGARHAIDVPQRVAEDCGYHVIGILDKYYYGNTDTIKGIPIIGSEDQLLDMHDRQGQDWLKNCSFALTSWWNGDQYLGHHGLDDEIVRQNRVKLLEQSGAVCPTLIHPSVKFHARAETVTVGAGTLIDADSTFGPNMIIGNYCYIDWCVSMYTDVTIKNNVIVGAKSNLGHVTLEDNVRIGVSSLVVPVGSKQQGHMTIGKDSVVWIGCHAYKDVPDHHVWTKGDKILKRYVKSNEEN